MGFMTIYDFLEKLLKERSINIQTTSQVEEKHLQKLSMLIEWCVNNNIVEYVDDKIQLNDSIRLLISLPMFGLSYDRLVKYINWHEFEEFVSNVFSQLGWDVYKGYTHIKVDRFQIDIIALNTNLSLSVFVECKHWKRLNTLYTSIHRIVKEHLNRIDKYLKNCEWVRLNINKLKDVKYIAPMMVVLYDLPIKIVNGVPIVPVPRLVDFVVNIDVYIDALNILIFENRCYIGS